MLTHPLVTVIVPNYNHARFLKQRLDSIFNQTYTNFEVIFLDDNSTDNSLDLLNSYHDARIAHKIYNNTNSGSPFKQWKKGLELAKGELIWIAESDDWAEVTFLDKMVSVFRDFENVAVAYCDLYNVDEDGKVLGIEHFHYNHDKFGQNNHYELGSDFVIKYMLSATSIVNASSVLFVKEYGLKHIDKILDFRMAGDWLFWNAILSENKVNVFYWGQDKLNFFRHSLQSTRNFPTIEKKQNGLIERSNVLFSTLKMYNIDQEKISIKKRELLDWWSKDHNISEMLDSSFLRILEIPLFQDKNVIDLYKHYIRYRIKNLPLIKAMRN